MAELKPVPSGYDSAALSSMLGYLANARKSHDNNPFMRTILDQQARDNKQEYLADADLTRSLQQDDNNVSMQQNLAKLLMDQAKNRSDAGQAVFEKTGAMPEPFANQAGVDANTDDLVNKLLGMHQQTKALEPIEARAEIRNKDAMTYKAKIDAAGGRADVGDYTDIEDLNNMPNFLNHNPDDTAKIRSSAAQGQNAAVVTASNSKGGTFFQDVAVRRDPNDPSRLIREDILPSEITARKAKGEEIVSEERRVQSTTGSRGRADNTAPERPKSIARPVNDIARAEALLKAGGHKYDGIQIDQASGKVEALINGEWVIVGEE